MTDSLTEDNSQTPEFTDDRPQCFKCDSYITEWAIFIRKGYWNGSEFEKNPIERHWCKSCYRKHRDREAAAHYEIEEADQLWKILEAADGELVADTYPLTIGGRGYVRIVDGEPQALTIKRVAKEKDVFIHEAREIEDYDEEDFYKLFGVEDDTGDSPPRLVYIKPANETPFEGFSKPHEQQSKLKSENKEEQANENK